MTLGIIAEKVGMTQVFNDKGEVIPVTVLQYGKCAVTQVKTIEKDGYSAIQVNYGDKKVKNKALVGHFKQAKVEAKGALMEFRLDDVSAFSVGDEIKLDVLDDVAKVHVIATSKGKGFAGCVKRHNFKTQDATHGNSLSHRAPGSTGQCQDPGRVFKGKKMAGRMGHERVTVKNLDLVSTDADENIILVRGAVPGARGTYVVIQPIQTNAGA